MNDLLDRRALEADKAACHEKTLKKLHDLAPEQTASRKRQRREEGEDNDEEGGGRHHFGRNPGNYFLQRVGKCF